MFDMKSWEERRRERKAYLNEMFPTSSIKGIDTDHLKKLGYALGIGSNETKRELLDRMVERQDMNNPIILLGADDNYYINKDLKIMGYMEK